MERCRELNRCCVTHYFLHGLVNCRPGTRCTAVPRMANWSRTSQGCGDEGSQMYHHELVPHYLMFRMFFAATWLKKQQPTTNYNDYVVPTRNAGRHSRVSLSNRLEGFIFPGPPHPKEPRHIFGHILTQVSPWDPLWICAALMYPNTVKFLIKSLENLWKIVQIHRISSEILPSSGSPSFTASLDREV
jgi:hypothetical protein